jgi:hypothetical protein
MNAPSITQDVEKDLDRDSAQPPRRVQHQKPAVQPFAGRLGGNQTFILDRDDASNAQIIEAIPDAAPGMTLAEQFDLKPFRSISLWKAAALEGMGEFSTALNENAVAKTESFASLLLHLHVDRNLAKADSQSTGLSIWEF